ncbi:MAG TPA: MMPL family transporter, partial [Acidimicrobiales bacterium]|nr:MMPL family transporter [Acidimicrobiales bacterium]
RIVIQTDPVTWVNQQSQLIRNVHALEQQIGSASELDVFVQSKNVFDQQTVNFVSGFEADQLAANPTRLKPPASIVSLTALIAYVPHTTNVIPPAADVRAVFEAAPPDIQRITATSGGSAFDLIFPARTSSLDELGTTVDGMRAVHPPAGITAAPAGIAVVGVGLLDNLNANRVLLTYLSILFVLAFLTLRLRSFVRALLSLVPVLVAVGLATLLAFAFGFKLSPATAVSGPLVVAACTEFTSLMLLRFIEERSRGLDPRQAVDVMASRTGRAFIVSGLTCIAGVATVATSSLPLLQGFGIVVAFNVTIALLCALVVLPPVLVWADERNWVSRGMLRPDPEARPLVSEPVSP